MFEASRIKELIEQHIPDCTAHVVDEAGDKEHFTAEVISPTFTGKSRVQQHMMVYKALGPLMGREIHALQLSTRTPIDGQ